METAICLCNMLNTREQSEEKTLLDKSHAIAHWEICTP